MVYLLLGWRRRWQLAGCDCHFGAHRAINKPCVITKKKKKQTMCYCIGYSSCTIVAFGLLLVLSVFFVWSKLVLSVAFGFFSFETFGFFLGIFGFWYLLWINLFLPFIKKLITTIPSSFFFYFQFQHFAHHPITISVAIINIKIQIHFSISYFVYISNKINILLVNLHLIYRYKSKAAQQEAYQRNYTHIYSIYFVPGSYRSLCNHRVIITQM